MIYIETNKCQKKYYINFVARLLKIYDEDAVIDIDKQNVSEDEVLDGSDKIDAIIETNNVGNKLKVIQIID